MAVQFQCTQCGGPVAAAERQSGDAVPCPACGAMVTVPGAGAPQAAPPATGDSPYGGPPPGAMPDYSQQPAEPAGGGIGGRVGGIVGLILLLLLINAVLYFLDCGFIIY